MPGGAPPDALPDAPPDATATSGRASTSAPGATVAPPDALRGVAGVPTTLPARPLDQRKLLLPVRGATADALTPGFDLARGAGRHEAIDIMAPTGTPVVAVDDGRIEKLFTSKAGGLTIYQFDPEREHAYYYAHLDHYAPGLADGQEVERGQLIGYVGTTGNAPKDAPHLHFAIFRLGEDKHWWQGTAVDPYPLLRKAESPGS